jgi:hypothetical protein
MHCYLRYFSVYLKSVLRYKFLILDTYLDTIYVGMNVRILGYYSEPKEICEQKRLGNHEPKGKI